MHYNKPLIMLGVLALLSGCSTMLAQVQYGKVHTMQSALNEAAADCDDEQAQFRAHYWAGQGANDVADQLPHLSVDSDEYREAQALLRDLSRLTFTRDPAEQCKNIQTAAKATDRFIATLRPDAVYIAQK